MSWQAMEAMKTHSRAGGIAKVVGMAIAYYAPPDSLLAFPKNEELRRWGLDERQIQRGLRTLEDLGELRRQPELESYERRRVYLVDPAGASAAALQLPLIEPLGDSLPPGLPPGQPPGSTRARVRNEEIFNAPPTPQNWGERTGASLQSGQSALHAVGLERAAGARRRRRRRRAEDGASVASEPCPLSHAGEDELIALKAAWDPLDDRLRDAIGAVQWAMWFARAHLHHVDEQLVLAVRPTLYSWCQRRYGRALSQICEQPVRLVACQSLEAIT